VYVIVDQGSYNIDGMLDVDVVSNICWEWKSIIRHPKSGLNCRIISYFGVSADSHGTVESIYDCSKTNVTVVSDRNVSVDCSIWSDGNWFREGKVVILNDEDVSMAIDGL
jgi:hypothetical protein